MRKGWLLSCVAAGLCMLAVGSTAFAESNKSNPAKAHHARTTYSSSKSSDSSSEGSEATESGSERSGGNANELGPPPGGGPGGPGGPGRGGPGGPAGGGPGGTVHSTSVLLNKAGTAYITVTSDSGTVKSVDATAGSLVITEGTKSVTYKTVTLTIPSDAKVILDGKSSALEKLTEGDRVSVSSSSEGTIVQAGNSSFDPKRIGRRGGPPLGGQPPISE